MKEIQYKEFSWNTHKKNWRKKRPNVCQFELTFRCDFHCIYCYSDCYNRPNYIRKELSTKEVKFILDRVYESGVIWICFTGGDPLTRADFLDIYSYAKDKGFIITIFTNCYSLTSEIANYLKDRPPFVVEITLNAVTEKTFEEISQVEGSFERTRQGLEMLIERKIPLKIKTMVLRNNLEELPKIKKFVEGLGMVFRPSPMLYARLNGDTTPCKFRISLNDVLDLNKRVKTTDPEECEEHHQKSETNHLKSTQDRENRLFRCAIGTSDGFHIDPYGDMIACSNIRRPAVNLLENSISDAHSELSSKIRIKEFRTDSRCSYCELRDLCYWCPGKALLETGDMESHLEWFCELAHLAALHAPRSTLHAEKEVGNAKL